MIREIFEEGHDPGSEIVRTYFQTMTEDEICASLLLLACQRSGNEQVIQSYYIYCFLMKDFLAVCHLCVTNFHVAIFFFFRRYQV